MSVQLEFSIDRPVEGVFEFDASKAKRSTSLLKPPFERMARDEVGSQYRASKARPEPAPGGRETLEAPDRD